MAPHSGQEDYISFNAVYGTFIAPDFSRSRPREGVFGGGRIEDIGWIGVLSMAATAYI